MSRHVTDTAARTVNWAALECQIGDARVAFPTRSVAKLIQYEIAGPIPLAADWVGGISLYSGKPLVSISLWPRGAPRVPRRRFATGVFLEETVNAPYGLAVEVVRAVGLAEVVAIHEPSGISRGRLPAWLKEARTSDGRSVGWVNAAELLSCLSGG
jgi:chemotaxis signal transduction protein